MAKTPMYDPLSSEARSPWLAGLTEACAKLSNILDLKVSTFTDLPLTPVDDRLLIYQAPLGNKLWMNSPAPVIRKNGIVITSANDHFTINYLGGSVEFDDDSALTKNDTLTADATYIVDGSNTLSNIIDRLDTISLTAGQFKGYFPDVSTMKSSLGNGVLGNYALVGGTENTFYIWNPTLMDWVKCYKETDLTNYYTIQEVDDLVDSKEDLIIPVGTPDTKDFYFAGDKSWVNLPNKVNNTALANLDFTNTDPVENGDTVVEGFGKLQAQINANVHDMFGTSDPTTSTVGQIGQDYTNTATGEKFHLVEISGSDYIWKKYQNELTLDTTPTSGSNNPITSGAVYNELQSVNGDLDTKADKVVPSAVNNIALLDASGNLVDSGKSVNDVGRSPVIDTITLTTAGWNGTTAPYTQTVSVNGVDANPAKQIILVSPSPDAGNVETIASCNTYCTGQGTNTLTFTSYDAKPTSALIFNISIQNL